MLSFRHTVLTSSVSYSHRASMGSSFWGVSLRYLRGRTCRPRFCRALTRSSKWSTALDWSYTHTQTKEEAYIQSYRRSVCLYHCRCVSEYRSDAHIQLSNQTLHLIHVFELGVVFLVDLCVQPLQQLLSVTCLLVVLNTHTYRYTHRYFRALPV